LVAWPGAPAGDLGAQFLAAIEAKIADPQTPEEGQSELRRLRDSAGEVGQGVVTALLARLIKSHSGL
jgi:hypothetical protein